MSSLSYNPDAIWISHSALEEFFRCPKSYYYRYLYTNSSGLRVTIADPNLTLGTLVDETVKYYFQKAAEPTLDQLLWNLDFKWKLKSGRGGGFTSPEQEASYKEKAKKFITTFHDNIKKLNLDNPQVPEFLQMMLADDVDVRLCGTPDLIVHQPDGTIHVIDIKTSERESSFESLQLPIYSLLIEKELGKKVSKTSYWYLNLHTAPKEVSVTQRDFLEDIRFKTQAILQARSQNDFKCLKGETGCFKCTGYEFIKNGTAVIVGKDKKRVVYFVDRTQTLDSVYSNDLPF